jgi:hypothetical protein
MKILYENIETVKSISDVKGEKNSWNIYRKRYLFLFSDLVRVKRILLYLSMKNQIIDELFSDEYDSSTLYQTYTIINVTK